MKKPISKNGGRRLTARQAAFVQEYLIDLNATQAAIRAGYSRRTANEQGCRLLTNVSVASAIEAAQMKRSARTEITQDMVLAELAKIGFYDIRKIVRWGNTKLRAETSEGGQQELAPYHGLVLTAADEIDDDTAAAISEISQSKEGLKVKFHDKKGALVDIGRHLGMFPNKTELTGHLDVNNMTDEEIRAELAALAVAGIVKTE